jgi:hypothetical protein
MTEAYPLQWPQQRLRTSWTRRKNGAFRKDGHDITTREAMTRLRRELDKLGVSSFVLSANLARNIDGTPRSGQPQPSDPGIALYFQLKGKPHCMPCDTYNRVEQNIAAIAAHIDATRAIERYGVSTVAETFTGFVALPAPGAKRPWREVLGVDPTWIGGASEIEVRYRTVAKNLHPDLPGGSHDAMAELNAARGAAIRELTA